MTEYYETYLGADLVYLNILIKIGLSYKNKGDIVFAQTSTTFSDTDPKVLAPTASAARRRRPSGEKCLALLSSSFLELGDRVRSLSRQTTPLGWSLQLEHCRSAKHSDLLTFVCVAG